jgi:hypothetical protein
MIPGWWSLYLYDVLVRIQVILHSHTRAVRWPQQSSKAWVRDHVDSEWSRRSKYGEKGNLSDPHESTTQQGLISRVWSLKI